MPEQQYRLNESGATVTTLNPYSLDVNGICDMCAVEGHTNATEEEYRVCPGCAEERDRYRPHKKVYNERTSQFDRVFTSNVSEIDG